MHPRLLCKRGCGFSSEYVGQQQEQHDARNAEHTGDDGVEPVEPQRNIDKAAEKVEDKEKNKPEQRVEQQLKRPFDRFSQQLQQQNEKGGCRCQRDREDQ